jgi:hypothetical protein
MQNLRKLYRVRQQQIMDLEKRESLTETDLETLKEYKSYLSSLREKILNRALSAEQAEEEARVPNKFEQSDYLLLKEENKKLWKTLVIRDQNVTTVKARMKYELGFCHKEILPLKDHIKALEEQNSTLKREAKKKIGNNTTMIKERQKLDQRLFYVQASRTNILKQLKEGKVEIAKLKAELSASRKSQACQEKNLTKCLNKAKKDFKELGDLKSRTNVEEIMLNTQNRLRKAIEELGVVKGFASAAIRQLQNTNTKVESLQELEKSHELMMKKMKRGKNNLILKEPSGIDDSLATSEVITNQSDCFPITFAASYDPGQDHGGEHIVSSEEHHQIMIVVESDEDEMLEDEAPEEL